MVRSVSLLEIATEWPLNEEDAHAAALIDITLIDITVHMPTPFYVGPNINEFKKMSDFSDH